MEVNIIAMINAPVCLMTGFSFAPNKELAVVAKPIATPAWGTKVSPKYYFTCGSHLVMAVPVYAPRYLPNTLKSI